MTFSIIIPVYNVAPYLRECLRSVVDAAQTLEKIGVENRCTADVEIICVDDGSTDGSGEILDEYVEKGEKLGGGGQWSIKVLHQPNRGVSAARNRGLDVATGDWIWFVDGDDVLSRDALMVVAKAIDQKGRVDAIRIPFVEGREPWTGWDAFSGRDGGAAAGCKFNHLFVGAPGFGLFRRSAIGSLRFENFKWYEDVLFTVKFLRRCGAIAEIDTPLYFYRQRDGSAVHAAMTAEDVRSVFTCQRLVFDELNDWSEKCEPSDFEDVWRAFHGRVYYTLGGKYFDLSAKDRKKLLPIWLEQQVLVHDKYPVCFEWRLRIALARFFNSGRLVKFLALRGLGWRKYLSF